MKTEVAECNGYLQSREWMVHEFLLFDTLRNRFSALLHEPSESLCLSVHMGSVPGYHAMRAPIPTAQVCLHFPP